MCRPQVPPYYVPRQAARTSEAAGRSTEPKSMLPMGWNCGSGGHTSSGGDGRCRQGVPRGRWAREVVVHVWATNEALVGKVAAS